jgi:hypothetical protein
MALTERVKVVALKSFRYGTRQLTAGDVFDVMPMDRRTLNALNKTRDVQEGDIKSAGKAKAAEEKQPKMPSIPASPEAAPVAPQQARRGGRPPKKPTTTTATTEDDEESDDE